MGGSKTKTVQQGPTVEQQRQEETNKYNLSKAKRDAAAMDNRRKQLEYTADRERAAWTKGNAAREAVTKRRTKLIEDSGQLLTDFERQEKIRLLKARKGVGQVKEADTMLSQEDRKNAIKSLNLGEDYWTTQRDKAYKSGYSGGFSSFGGLVGKYAQAALPGLYEKKSISAATPQSVQNGIDYTNSRTRSNLLLSPPRDDWMTSDSPESALGSQVRLR